MLRRGPAGVENASYDRRKVRSRTNRGDLAREPARARYPVAPTTLGRAELLATSTTTSRAPICGNRLPGRRSRLGP